MYCVYHLNGWPASGKLTVAKALQNQIGGRVLDNHLFLNFVSGIVERGNPHRSTLIETIYEAMRVTLRETADTNLIFTNALVETYSIDKRRYAIVENLAHDLGWPFVPVTLTCERKTLHGRLKNPDRIARGKLADIDAFEKLWAIDPPFINPLEHPNYLCCDTTRRTPEETAERIAFHTHST